MTEVIVQARKAHERGEVKLFSYDDWRPEWAHQVPLTNLVSAGNWHNYRRKRNVTFGDHMRQKWNNPRHPRSPYQYFDKVLAPVGVDRNTGDLAYRYVQWLPDAARGRRPSLHRGLMAASTHAPVAECINMPSLRACPRTGPLPSA